MSSSSLSQLRDMLEMANSYQLPDKFLESSSTTTMAAATPDDDDILERYKAAKKEYLERRFSQVFYDHVGTYNGQEFAQKPRPPSEEEFRAIQEKRASLQQVLQERAASVSQQLLEFQSNYRMLQGRREELAQTLQELEQAQDPMEEEQADEDAEDDDVDEAALTYEEQQLLTLQEKKAQLLQTLARLKQETHEKQVSLSETKNQVETLRSTSPNNVTSFMDVAELQAHVESNQQKATEFHEMVDFYDSVRGIMEELSGMRILSVDKADPDNDLDGSVTLTLELLENHRIQIKLSPSSHNHQLILTSASFLTSKTLSAHVEATPSQESPGGGTPTSTTTATTSTYQADIPPLDDLVQVATHLGPVEDLRFLVRETLNRLRTLQARVEELARLRSRYLTQLGPLASHEDQQVVCSLNEGLTVVMRLTADCPLVNPSVYVVQLLGVGGWDAALLQDWKQGLEEESFQRPTDLMKALVQYVSQHPNCVPPTPSMPSRTHKME